MKSRRFRALWLAPLLVLSLAAATPLVDPAPLVVPAGLTEKQVEKAVRMGVVKRGWSITGQQKGYVEATLNVRQHMAKVGISYDTQRVSLQYLDSSNLDYAVKKDVPVIHKNYLKWANNVLLDINVELQAAFVDTQGG
jgi:hypothetical protein